MLRITSTRSSKRPTPSQVPPPAGTTVSCSRSASLRISSASVSEAGATSIARSIFRGLFSLAAIKSDTDRLRAFGEPTIFESSRATRSSFSRVEICACRWAARLLPEDSPRRGTECAGALLFDKLKFGGL